MAEKRGDSTFLLAIDPGLDDTGFAIFKVGPTPRTLQDALRGLYKAGEWSTPSQETTGHRLASLVRNLEACCESWEPDAIVIEVPSYSGSYTGGRERRSGVNKLYMSIGALLAAGATTGAKVYEVPAIRERKETRHELLEFAAGMLLLELPAGPRGGKREDAWDAIWLGCQAALELTTNGGGDG